MVGVGETWRRIKGGSEGVREEIGDLPHDLRRVVW
tara:strand:- start:307 stop:411 length:105 start_codon:yes stop_codon:yes gene_type:complete